MFNYSMFFTVASFNKLAIHKQGKKIFGLFEAHHLNLMR